MFVEITSGPLKGFQGEAVHFPEMDIYHVSFPSRSKPLHKESFRSTDIYQIEGQGSCRSILENKEFIKLQPSDQVQIAGCKASCSSVWCPDCYVSKGGSNRVASRLEKMDFRNVRQVVLTVDPKKFQHDPQLAFETIRENKDIPQLIHNLKRTAGVIIKDWVWILEWHSDGFPHWHLFVETQRGAAGKIGNKNLLKYWRHGIVLESFIKSQEHWNNFTGYFGAKGYFDPASSCQKKDKSHQLHLPDWAMSQTYRIRKTGSMRLPKEAMDPVYDEDHSTRSRDNRPKTYHQLLGACGQSVYAQVRRGGSYLVWTKFNIPYKKFRELSGEFIQQLGYVVQFRLKEFFIFYREVLNAQ